MRGAGSKAVFLSNWEAGSLLSFADKKADVDRLLIVTNEEEKIIQKEGREIEVIPAHRFLLDFLPSATE